MDDASALPRPIRIGISSCLLGQEVRFDGGHKRDAFLTGTFGQFVEWVPVCPEVESGFGTPRPAMRLVRVKRRRPAAHGQDGGRSDRPDGGVREPSRYRAGVGGSERVRAQERLAELRTRAGQDLRCARRARTVGARNLRVEARWTLSRSADRRGGPPVGSAPARELRRAGVCVLAGFEGCSAADGTSARSVRFHTAHKLVLMAHSPAAYQRLGRIVAGARSIPRKDLERGYSAVFMAALSVLATPRRHANVLQHMVGYFKDQLDRASKVELLAAVEEYRRGLVPLVVPITLRPTLRADSQHRVSGRSGVPRSASERADAPQSRLSSALVFSASR